MQVDLSTLLHWLIDLAKDPLSRQRRRQLRDGGGLGPEAAALLRFKEAEHARSNLHRCVVNSTTCEGKLLHLRGGGSVDPEAAALLRFKEAEHARSNLHRCVRPALTISCLTSHKHSAAESAEAKHVHSKLSAHQWALHSVLLGIENDVVVMRRWCKAVEGPTLQHCSGSTGQGTLSAMARNGVQLGRAVAFLSSEETEHACSNLLRSFSIPASPDIKCSGTLSAVGHLVLRDI
eukprot:1159920-Pelagomonas_calceolata.AAC.1